MVRISDNYELRDGVSLPRSSLYENYLDFCTGSSIPPMNAARYWYTFCLDGDHAALANWCVRPFPDSERADLVFVDKFDECVLACCQPRQSKYHYYGVCVRETAMHREKLARHQVTDNGRSPYMDVCRIPRYVMIEYSGISAKTIASLASHWI
jgi:hypothetical protein